MRKLLLILLLLVMAGCGFEPKDVVVDVIKVQPKNCFTCEDHAVIRITTEPTAVQDVRADDGAWALLKEGYRYKIHLYPYGCCIFISTNPAPILIGKSPDQGEI